MRLLVVTLGLLSACHASTQAIPTVGCYRFSAPFFWRASPDQTGNAVKRDSTSILRLSSTPASTTAPNSEHIVVPYFLPADSVYGSARAPTWQPHGTDSLVIRYFYSYTALELFLRVDGDTLRGLLRNHADVVGGPLPQRSVNAVRIPCP